ncbi:MAG: lipid-A-disaccharide synthase [Bacteroidales bacterium]|nr:lipid-A-disaccharide synthase [Bacteroidales bacterium]
MKYYIITGEASGDLHAANLMKAIKLQDAHAEFRVWGGDLMEKQGAEIVRHYRDLAFMGFVEVLFNLRTILSNITFCKQDLLTWEPDVLILVDYPGFNLRIAKFAHQHKFKVVYYISPQVWAWKKSRVHEIKKHVGKMLVILPFEKDFYSKYKVDVEFVGHPLLDALPVKSNDLEFKKQNGLSEKPIVALLPGSRKQEINKMLSIMLTIVPDFPDYQFVIAGAPSIDNEYYQPFVQKQNVNLVANKTHQLLMHSEAALVTSGTATLETALLEIPEVVCYKGSAISYQIAKRIVDIPFISLVNLIMDKEVVKELIQNDLNYMNLKRELKKILADSPKRSQMLHEFAELKNKLGTGGASTKAAQEIANYLKMNS